ncbi:hypothetical protein ONZ45_g5353 [Pleurotus djamor]|nr:hypothetical protein ONZ45_g5353 [Pleurotus djamor]
MPALLSLDTVFLDEIVNTITPIFSTALNADSFPSLHELSIGVPFDRALAAFTAWGQSDTLDHLEIRSDVFELADTYRDIVAVIVTNFPLLTSLHVEASATLIPSDIPKPEFHIQSLRPIHKLNRLRSLAIHYTTPLLMGDGDLVQLIHALEHLSRLHLNPSPTVPITKPGLHITALSMLSSSKTVLHDVGLYVDTSAQGFGVIGSDSQDVYRQRIDGLESLSLGYSQMSLETVEPVVDYLRCVLTEDCAFSTLWDGVGAPWEKVSTLLRGAHA